MLQEAEVKQQITNMGINPIASDHQTWLEHPPFMNVFSIEMGINGSFPIAMFEYQNLFFF